MPTTNRNGTMKTKAIIIDNPRFSVWKKRDEFISEKVSEIVFVALLSSMIDVGSIYGLTRVTMPISQGTLSVLNRL